MDKIKVYVAGALFNGRECVFNSLVAEGLEKRGYKTILPQRDGFEFGNLKNSFTGKLKPELIEQAVSDVIYLLDVGHFIPQSDALVVNLDEPVDEGSVVKACYGRFMGKPIIGFRTDARTPYGSINGRFGGMHFFPAYQCDRFVKHPMPCRTPSERKKGIDELVDKIDKEIQNLDILPLFVTINNVAKDLGLLPEQIKAPDYAKTIFKGIKNIHSEQGLNEIVSRYLANKENF